ncbi:MAG: hypothetical protein JWP63_1608 [Candidatus Solibacter sp.]|nr:hypothetical protein [Candidatus Solibacter sp.]
MKRCMSMLALCLLMSVLVGKQAHAQCPAGVTNPLQALAGSWAFKLTGLNFGAAGIFTATVGVDPRIPAVTQGLLSATTTSNNNGIVVRQETETNSIKYQVFPDCSGGTITLVATSRPITFDFYFLEGFTEIYLVSIDNLILPSAWVGPGASVVITGTASRRGVVTVLAAAQ